MGGRVRRLYRRLLHPPRRNVRGVGHGIGRAPIAIAVTRGDHQRGMRRPEHDEAADEAARQHHAILGIRRPHSAQAEDGARYVTRREEYRVVPEFRPYHRTAEVSAPRKGQEEGRPRQSAVEEDRDHVEEE